MAKITEDYISFETAKLLKEKGFEQDPDYATSWYANQYYKNSCQGEWFEGEHQIIEDIDDKCNISYLSERGIFIPAPTLQMAMKWLREVYKIHLDIKCGNFTDGFEEESKIYEKWYVEYVRLNGCKLFIVEDDVKCFDSYEEACEAGIKYCLENLI